MEARRHKALISSFTFDLVGQYLHKIASDEGTRNFLIQQHDVPLRELRRAIEDSHHNAARDGPNGIPWRRDEENKHEVSGPHGIPWMSDESAREAVESGPPGVPWKKDGIPIKARPNGMPWKKERYEKIKSVAGPPGMPWKKESTGHDANAGPPGMPWKRNNLNLKSEKSLNGPPGMPWKRTVDAEAISKIHAGPPGMPWKRNEENGRSGAIAKGPPGMPWKRSELNIRGGPPGMPWKRDDFTKYLREVIANGAAPGRSVSNDGSIKAYIIRDGSLQPLSENKRFISLSDLISNNARSELANKREQQYERGLQNKKELLEAVDNIYDMVDKKAKTN